MPGKKMLITVRVITKILGMIFLIGGLILLSIGGILRLIMGPIQIPEVDDVMMIGFAALIVLFQYIPYALMIMGGFLTVSAVLHLAISGIISYFNDMELNKQKVKTYLLVICSVFVGIILLPSAYLMIGSIAGDSEIGAKIVAVSLLINIDSIYALMLIFILTARSKILNYNDFIQEESYDENKIED